MKIDKLISFIKLFGTEGESERFKGCTANNGDVCNGEYKIWANIIYFTYEDKNGLLYDSCEMPNRIINIGLLKENISVGAF